MKCEMCNDTKEVEVIVMGTDTDLVECPLCSTKDKYKNYQEWYNQNK